MKICYVGWGDHVHLERWAGYFADQGFEVTVISMSGRGDYPGRVIQYPLGLARRGARWKVLKLRYLLWKIKPDVVHVHWAHFANLVASAWSGPLVVTVWGSEIWRLETHSRDAAESLTKGLDAADIVTCDSEDLSVRLKSLRKEGAGNVHVIQWGVNVKSFCPGAPDAILMAELGVSGRPVVFSPRSFRSLYNLESVVSAFASVLSQVPNAVLLMKNYNGNADYTQAIKQSIDDLGISESVRILDDIPYERMRDLYRISTVTVSVPLSDSTPMSVLEAMSCGSVPIVSDLPALREWVRDGWNGYLVPASDTNYLAAQIIDVLKHPEIAAEWARRNRKLVEEKANQAEHMGYMTDIYRKVLKVGAEKGTRKGIAQLIALVSLFTGLQLDG
ncbi:MAG TPA: glycosyltransferase family 4 protein [Candidatus Saccharimonadales bacterium]|nr:glycosyltransferase family 4 protein [Candidatus Saccharimonadales bacterium]